MDRWGYNGKSNPKEYEMPLAQVPILRTYQGIGGQKQYAISFSYDFQADQPSTQSPVQGVLFQGVLYEFNQNSLQNVPANIPAFRSMQFTLQSNVFSPASGDFSGDLFISIPSTGQLSRINNGLTSTPGSVGVTVGMIQLPSLSPTVIDFINAVDGNGSMSGFLTATLFTELFDPYVTSFYTNVA
jgi:hypothetical protein